MGFWTTQAGSTSHWWVKVTSCDYAGVFGGLGGDSDFIALGHLSRELPIRWRISAWTNEDLISLNHPWVIEMRRSFHQRFSMAITQRIKVWQFLGGFAKVKNSVLNFPIDVKNLKAQTDLIYEQSTNNGPGKPAIKSCAVTFYSRLSRWKVKCTSIKCWLLKPIYVRRENPCFFFRLFTAYLICRCICSGLKHFSS